MKVVLLPGLDGTGRLFERLHAELPADLEPVIVRYPTAQLLSYDELVGLVLEQLPDESPWLLLGESFSGPISLELAARKPRGLVGLVLVATFHRAPTHRPLAALGWLAVPGLFKRPMPQALLRLLLTGRDAPQALVDEVRAALAEVSPEVMAGRVRAVLKVDASDAARALTIPTLYLEAKHDALMRSGLSKELSQLIPDFTLAQLDSPHLVLQRRPRECAQLLSEFARRAGG